MIIFKISSLIWLAGVAGESTEPIDTKADGVQERPTTITIDGIHSPHIPEHLRVMIPYSGYGVLNVSVSQCRSQKVKLVLTSCDGEKIQRETVKCEVLSKGKLICLSLKFKEKNCVTVTSERLSSGPIQMPAFSMTVDIMNTFKSGWSRTKHSSTSIISMNKYEGAPIYEMELQPDGTQVACSSTATSTLNGRVEGDQVFFYADWTKLDKNCSYRAAVTPYNHCPGEALSTEVRFPVLSYFEFPDEVAVPFPEELMLGNKTVQAIISIFSIVLVVSLTYLLWICRRRRQALARLMKDAEELVTIRNDVPPSARRKVLIVYARDVADKVALLISSLQSPFIGQVLDLFDRSDLEKLADGAMWLARHFLDENTSVILVESKAFKKLQDLHSSPLETCALCAVKARELHAGGNEEGKGEALLEGETEPFQFLLVDAIHKIRNSCIKQDQTRFYQVEFGDAARDAKCALMTPNCLYTLPGHYQYLVSALNRLEDPDEQGKGNRPLSVSLLSSKRPSRTGKKTGCPLEPLGTC